MTRQTRELVPAVGDVLLYSAPGGELPLNLRADRGHPTVAPARMPATNRAAVAGSRIGPPWLDSRQAIRDPGHALAREVG